MPEPLRIHIGHHFFGAGNIGDDFMLAGFLATAREMLGSVELTCCVPFPLGPLLRRFPEIEWLPLNDALRDACVRECDVWLGLGDTPFQIDAGPWMLDHLAAEAARCRALGRPMFFLGVGVESPDVFAFPQVDKILSETTRIFTRDGGSAALLRAQMDPDRVEEGADLAHVFLQELARSPIEKGTIAFTLNFESASQYSKESVNSLVENFGAQRSLWQVQEVRPLPGSEMALLDALRPDLRNRLILCKPDYVSARTVESLVAVWESPEVWCTSRYHAALAGAWAGARTIAIERSAKIRFGAEQVGLEMISSITDQSAIRRAVSQAEPASRARLAGLARTSRRMVTQMIKAARSEPRRAEDRGVTRHEWGRAVRALAEREQTLTESLTVAEADRAARLRVIEDQGAQIEQLRSREFQAA